jgi:hypothetical protein
VVVWTHITFHLFINFLFSKHLFSMTMLEDRCLQEHYSLNLLPTFQLYFVIIKHHAKHSSVFANKVAQH